MIRHLRMALPLAALLAGAGSLPAASQTVYRCGNSYSQEPCPGGKAIDASDARSAAQKGQTDEAVRRDAAAADAMEKARIKEESRPVPVGMPAPKAAEPTPVQATASKKRKKAKGRQPEHFTAVAPGSASSGQGKKK